MTKRPLLLLLALSMAACTASAPKEIASPSAAPSSPSPSPPPPPIAPLTGLIAISGARTLRPVLAVKIDNHTAARPQFGLDKADIVYEEPVEGGITRFIAIYQSRDASKVGPIRSARLTDVDVLAQYGRCLLSFSGAAGYVLRALPKANLVLLPHGRFGSIYRRDRGRSAPHNLVSSTAELYRAAASARATPARTMVGFGELLEPPQPSPSPSVSPSPSPPALWPAGRRARIPFAGEAWTAVWRWHAASGTYARSHGSTPHRAPNGKRITAANVIVMRVRTQSTSEGAARHGTPELRLTGSGPAVLLRDGVRITGTWSRARLSSPTRFTDASGRAFVLKPGTTWVELIPMRIRPTYS